MASLRSIAHKPLKHPGFGREQGALERRGYSKESAGAILASAARNASPSAKRKNKRLKKV